MTSAFTLVRRAAHAGLVSALVAVLGIPVVGIQQAAAPPAQSPVPPNLPGVVPLSGDSSPDSVRLALDEALRKAGLDMMGTFHMNADGTVTYQDGDVKIVGRVRGGGVLIAAAVDEGPMNTAGQRVTPAIEPIEFTVSPGVLPDDAATSVDIDGEEDLVSINDPSVMNATPDALVQLMIAILRAGGAALVAEPAQRGASPVSKAGRRIRGVFATLLPGTRGISAERAFTVAPRTEFPTDMWLAPLSQTASARDAASAHPVRMILTSLGTSTGEAFQVQVINDGTHPVRLSGSVVLEPIAKEAQAAVQRQLQRAVAPGRGTTAKLDAYCLEFLRLPPSAGTLFRIASPELQKKFAPIRKILDASGRLQQAGLLKPDSDPTSYFHSVTQWAIWSRQQKFTLESFQQAFIDHTSKNIKAAGRQWTKQFEQVIRGAVPHRWQQITAVLAEAERAAAPDRKSPGGTHAPR